MPWQPAGAFNLFATACVCSLLSLLVTGPVLADGPSTFSLSKIAPGIYVHRGQLAAIDDPQRGDSANIGFIVGERCVAVIDTGGSLATGTALRQAISATTPLPVCYVINTHVHFDHLLGNLPFKSTATRFVGHANLPAALAASQDYFARRFAAELDGKGQAAIVGPDLMVDTTMELDLGQRVLLLTAAPDAHTTTDLTVLDRATSTLWTGDLVFMERLPVLDGSLRGWLAWITAQRNTAVLRAVPGHGPDSAAWPSAMDAEEHYLRDLLAATRAAVAAGTFLEDFSAAAAAQPPTGWHLTALHARNASKAFREVEWE